MCNDSNVAKKKKRKVFYSKNKKVSENIILYFTVNDAQWKFVNTISLVNS